MSAAQLAAFKPVPGLVESTNGFGPDAAADAWLAGNQEYLVAEFERIAALLESTPGREGTGPSLEAADRHRNRVRDGLIDPPALELAQRLFGLSDFERDVLSLCAGVEMESRIAERCAALTGRPAATWALSLASLPNGHWSALSPRSPLRYWRLVNVAEGPPVSGALRIEERLLHYLAGVNVIDPAIDPIVAYVEPAPLLSEAHAITAGAIVERWLELPESPPIVQLVGPDGDGHEDVASRTSTSVGLALHVLRSDDIPASPTSRAALAALWSREALLLRSALLIRVTDSSHRAAITSFVERVDGPVMISTTEPVPMDGPHLLYEVGWPKPSDQRTIWQLAFDAEGSHPDGGLDLVAQQFRLSARSIRRIAAASATSGGVASRDLVAAVRREVRHRDLDELAQRLDPTATWQDLILPEEQIDSLRRIETHVSRRMVVYEDWGFVRTGGRGLGISVLFAGESGTGKTLAAEVLANELSLALYRIDLSSVVSKYIGETEKNLRRVFDAADETGAVLLFDEADALFGKRSEVRDSHDRYANVEISYLLQRMEAYRGLAILTTNARSALDRSFLRRIRFIIPFPFPDSENRERIWRQAFPRKAPVAALDFGKLARLPLTGGSIHNIALLAAFEAARARRRISMTGIADATRIELSKADKTPPAAELRDWR